MRTASTAVTVTGGTGASGGGGGIEDSGTLRVDDASISGNSVGSELSGGGIDVAGSLELTRSLVSRNRSVSGGGIKNGGTLSVVDSTIARNESGDSGPNHNGNGGGIDASANTHTTVAYSTIVGNRCWNGSGCGAGINNAASVSNSILARNIESQAGIPSVPGSCGNGADHVIDEGHNVDDVDSNCNLTASTSRRNVNPRLGPLANNGGPTDTFALLEGSPAINRGGNAACSPTDQRGAPRKQFAVCDSGSFEVQPAPRIAELRVKPESFRAEGGGVAATAGSKPAGATVSYRDSRAARTTFTVLRRSRGVRSGKRCVAPPKKPKSGDQSQRCIRFVPVWSFSHQDVVGSNHFHFSGRHNGTKLRPHRYRLRAVASMWGVSSKPKHLSLTIVR
jgi:hypothetical protein